MEGGAWNRDLLDELSQAMRDASICGLGQRPRIRLLQ